MQKRRDGEPGDPIRALLLGRDIAYILFLYVIVRCFGIIDDLLFNACIYVTDYISTSAGLLPLQRRSMLCIT